MGKREIFKKERNIQKREARTGERGQRLGGQDLFNVEKENPLQCASSLFFGLVETSEI